MTFSLQLVPYSKLIVVTCKLVPCFPIGSYPSILSLWILSVCLFIRLLVRVVIRQLSMHQSVHPSVHPTVRLVWLSVPL